MIIFPETIVFCYKNLNGPKTVWSFCTTSLDGQDRCRSVLPSPSSHDKLLLQIILLQVKTNLRNSTPKYPRHYINWIKTDGTFQDDNSTNIVI